MSIRDHYNKDVDIYRETISNPEDFQPSRVWALLASVRGMIDLLKGNEKYETEADGKVVIADYRLYMDVRDIKLLDRVVIDDNVYEIRKKHNPNFRGHHLELLIKLLPPGSDKEMNIAS
jgi:head-tail adaptor